MVASKAKRLEPWSQERDSHVVAIVQARVESSRLPGKVLLDLNGKSVIERVMDRVRQAKSLNQVVAAVPKNTKNAELRAILKNSGSRFVLGPLSDVLSRYAKAAVELRATTVVRITADCPLIDPSTIDKCVEHFQSQGLDYLRTSEEWPDGLDVEVFTAEALANANIQAHLKSDREHVTPFIARNAGLKRGIIDPDHDLPAIRITLDYPEDFEVINWVYSHFGEAEFSLIELVEVASNNPAVFSRNSQFFRNEGARMSTGEKLYSRAKRVIPGGTMLLSKRPEMHSPVGWPSYYERAEGCYIWDLDGKRYADVSWMGVGTNILGYANPKVDEAVRKVISSGNLSTLNAPEEVELAELLCELHPWAKMARFTRSGGEAGSVAVRIARAASGRDHVAFCGYHGWHDWYLSANLSDSSALDGHLLEGLSPAGVPRGLFGSATPFKFNDLESLEKVVIENSSGVIYMEVERAEPPTLEFLQGARNLATKFGAVLVFDECTSGFRSVLGGQHLKYGVHPDIVVLGKTLGNGYAINAVIGVADVMEHAQRTFMSSTFWTERIGPTAAIAAITEMRATGAPKAVDAIGQSFRDSILQIGNDIGLDIQVAGLPALTTFSIAGSTPQELRTLVTTRMLHQNLLASTAFYASVAHTPDVVQNYIDALADVLVENREHFLQGTITQVLPDGVVQSGFTRLA